MLRIPAVSPEVIGCVGADSYGANTGRYKGTEFVRPHAISVDHEDNLWLTDDSGNTITKCDRSGKRLMMIASNGGGLPKVLTTEAEMDAQKGNVAESSLKQVIMFSYAELDSRSLASVAILSKLLL